MAERSELLTRIKALLPIGGEGSAEQETVVLSPDEAALLKVYSPMHSVHYDGSLAFEASMVPGRARRANQGLFDKGLISPTEDNRELFEINSKGEQARDRLGKQSKMRRSTLVVRVG